MRVLRWRRFFGRCRTRRRCALTDIGDLRQGLLLLETAVEQDPSNAQAWAALGSSKILARRTLEGVADLQHSIRISPLDSRLAVWGSFLAFGLILSGDLEGALSEAETACRRDIRNHLPKVMASAIAIAAGNREQARLALDDAYRVRPELSEDEIVCLVGERSLAAMKAHSLI